MESTQATLTFENGARYTGQGFGAKTSTVCEVVFNTSMVGYQEIMSDPSYCGQLVCMTYPLIGNYGLTDEDYETRTPKMGGFIVREYNNSPSNYRYTRTLGGVLSEYGIPGIQGVDTREITRMIRNEGSMRALLSQEALSREEALAEIKNTPIPHDQVASVSCQRQWLKRTSNYLYTVVAIDCGIKRNIVRSLNKLGCNVVVVPHDTSPQRVLALRPDGLFLSNGPGDPQDAAAAIELVRALQGRLPIFGICLGHQIIALANGGATYKMKFGHRGGNHPVKNLITGRVEITSQNHSFAVDTQSLSQAGLTLTHINLLDNTAEGMCSEHKKLFSVQYHPESAPGPQDSGYLFEQFIHSMQCAKEVPSLCHSAVI